MKKKRIKKIPEKEGKERKEKTKIENERKNLEDNLKLLLKKRQYLFFFCIGNKSASKILLPYVLASNFVSFVAPPQLF